MVSIAFEVLAPFVARVSLRDLLTGQNRDVAELWGRFPVLLVKGALESDEGLISVAELFGRPVGSQRPGSVSSSNDLISRISNVSRDGGVFVLPDVMWHSDESYMEVPVRGTLLRAREVSKSGGETCFCDLRRAVAALSPSFRKILIGLLAVHDSTRDSAQRVRADCPEITIPEKLIGARHPLIRINPWTGDEALFLPPQARPYQHIVGIGQKEVSEIFRELWAHVDNTDLRWCHRWETGDVLVWDNGSVMHRRSPFPSHERRIMDRVVVRG